MFEALADGDDPTLKGLRYECMGGAVLGVDFQRQAAERAAVAALRLQDALAVAAENREDALDGVVCGCEGRVDDHGA